MVTVVVCLSWLQSTLLHLGHLVVRRCMGHVTMISEMCFTEFQNAASIVFVVLCRSDIGTVGGQQ